VPSDVVSSASGLLDMAGERMRQAMQAGGNRTESAGVLPATQAISIQRALELLLESHSGPVVPHLPALSRQLLPLLHLMNSELNLGMALPLAELEQRFCERNP
jgi:hypothetical protein